MMEFSEAANIVQGKLRGADKYFSGVAIDSREVEPDNLFVAIPGEKFDGHQFIVQSEKAGAVGAMVSTIDKSAFSQIEVSDTTYALGQLAKNWRMRFSIPVLAITGSNGKTTVTAMVSSILNYKNKCLSPQSSFNNQWGVPLTLLKLNKQHDFAVIEMGANHAGEIHYLTQLTQPCIALINNVGPAHLEGFGSLEEIASVKAEIFSGLSNNGVAVLNADDPFYQQWRSQLELENSNYKIMTFAINNEADLVARKIASNGFSNQFSLNFEQQSVNISLPLPGRHNVMNAAAAATVCIAAGTSLKSIKHRLENMGGINGRLNIKRGCQGAVVIDDAYNANPESMKAGIDVLGAFEGAKILVLGAMAELGENGPLMHHEIGAYARETGINKLFCLNPESQGENGQSVVGEYLKGFGDGANMYTDISGLVEALQQHLGDRVAVLVKGSRSSKMERVVDKITENSNSNNNNKSRDSKPC